MPKNLTRKDEIRPKIFNKVKIIEYLTKENFEGLGIALVELNGENDKVINERSDMFYYILSGEGEFLINNKKFSVGQGDLIFIPKKTIYRDKGKIKMLSISLPAFDTNFCKFIAKDEL